MEKYSVIELLRASSKMKISKEEEDIICYFSKNMTEDIGDLLERHRINLLFFKHVDHSCCLGNINKRIVERYSNQLFCLQYKYAEYNEYLAKVFAMSSIRDINCAVLKGFSFMEFLYKHNGILYRPFADVDILLKREDVAAFDAVLKSNNFVQGRIIEREIVPATRKELINYSLNLHQLFEYVCFSKYSNVSPLYHIEFDLNTSIFEGGMLADPIEVEELLTHNMRREISPELEIPCLDFTYGLIQLCYHFYKDTQYEMKKEMRADYRLMKFCDIREYILNYRNEIKWNVFIEVVKKARIEMQIWISLRLVSLFYGDLNIDYVVKELEDSRHIYSRNVEWEGLLL